MHLIGSEGETGDPESGRAYFRDGLDRTLAAIAGHHDVWIVKQIPIYDRGVAEAMAMNIRFNVPFSGVTRADYMRRVQFAHQTIDDLAGKHNVQVIDPAQILCPNFDCIYQHEEYPLYADRSHLSVYGARHIAPLFESVFSGSVNAGR